MHFSPFFAHIWTEWTDLLHRQWVDWTNCIQTTVETSFL